MPGGRIAPPRHRRSGDRRSGTCGGRRSRSPDRASDLALRTKSLESLLVEKGLVDPAALDEIFGSPTVTDILRELEKPGRDPRPAFKAAVFKDGVETLNDLQPGMVLDGAVTNVAAFGPFVDGRVEKRGAISAAQTGGHGGRSMVGHPTQVRRSRRK
jgi:transcriptional accessory protein Tex/SPT6